MLKIEGEVAVADKAQTVGLGEAREVKVVINSGFQHCEEGIRACYIPDVERQLELAAVEDW